MIIGAPGANQGSGSIYIADGSYISSVDNNLKPSESVIKIDEGDIASYHAPNFGKKIVKLNNKENIELFISAPKLQQKDSPSPGSVIQLNSGESFDNYASTNKYELVLDEMLDQEGLGFVTEYKTKIDGCCQEKCCVDQMTLRRSTEPGNKKDGGVQAASSPIC